MVTPRGIDLRHLWYFLAVFEELHFGRAAQRLHVTQPPMSQAIRALEDELGVRLFQRTSRAVRPTEAGKVFATEVRNVLASLDQAVAEARRAAIYGRVLRIGCSLYLPMEQIQRFLDAVHQRDPKAVQLSHDVGTEQIRFLQSGKLDVGIFPDVYEPEGLEAERLFPGEPMSALLPREHPLSAKPLLGPDDFRDENLLLIPRTPTPGYHDGLRAHIEQGGYLFRDIVELRGMTVRDALFAVTDGLGVCLAPPLPELHEAHGIVARPLNPPLCMPDAVIVWRKDPPRELQPTLRAIREIARDFYLTMARNLGSGADDADPSHASG